MNQRIIEIGRELLDNWDNIIAMGICLAAGIYGLFGGKFADPWLLTAITWALGLVALSSLKDRKARDGIQKIIETLKKKPSASDVLLLRSNFQLFQNTSANAQEICLYGASLVTLLGSHKQHLVDLILKNNTNIKVLILDQRSPVIKSAALCLDAGPAELVKEIELSEGIIRGIAEEVKDSDGVIELRQTQAYPNYGLSIINPNEQNGYMTVEYTGFQEKALSRPHIELTREGDRMWFDLYKNDFDLLWLSAVTRVKGGRKTNLKRVTDLKKRTGTATQYYKTQKG